MKNNEENLSLFSDNTGLIIAGVDEAGRGPLAGPVCAAAVILDEAHPIEGLADSKKLTKAKREKLEKEIKEKALCYSVAWGDVEEIDEINILASTLKTMTRAVETLEVTPDKVLVDGNKIPKLKVEAEAIVKGDAKVPAISAASILAKVARDRLMQEYDKKYPEYGFAKHSGYGTKAHIEAIQKFGITPLHRKTFEPIKSMLKK